MNKWVKKIVEAIICGIFYLLITLLFERDNIKWNNIIISTIIFLIVYFICSLFVDKYIANKNKK